jgi:hypothetical protein
VSVNAIRVFQIVWRILFDEEFHPKKDADTGLQSRLQVHQAVG